MIIEIFETDEMKGFDDGDEVLVGCGGGERVVVFGEGDVVEAEGHKDVYGMVGGVLEGVG